MTIDKSVWPEINQENRRLNVTQEEKHTARKAQVATFVADLNSAPSPSAGLDAQLLIGEQVSILDQQGDWVKIHASFDLSGDVDTPGYVGWLLSKTLSSNMVTPTHRVVAPRTFLYPGPDMKLPRSGYRSMGSLIRVTGTAKTRGTDYFTLESGEAIIASHVTEISENEPDYVCIAEKLIHTPYLWGGNTGFGIDCSGLVQLALRMCGKMVMRDTDMQAATLGTPVSIDDDWQQLKRGDLVFWRGHVAIAQGSLNGEAYLIHANGFTMDVTSEPARQAIERIAYLYEMPIGVRRL